MQGYICVCIFSPTHCARTATTTLPSKTCARGWGAMSAPTPPVPTPSPSMVCPSVWSVTGASWSWTPPLPPSGRWRVTSEWFYGVVTSRVDLPTHPYLTVLVRKSASSTDVRRYFSKYGHRVSRKYGNCDVNKCEFVSSEANRRALMGSYQLLTFAYFKPFPGLKYMAGPDWSKKFVKPMNIDFASKLYGSYPSSDMAGLMLSVISCCRKPMKRRKNAQKQGNKLRLDNNHSRKYMLASAKAAHAVQFLEKVFCNLKSRTTFADVNKIKSFECSGSA